ncbi:MAG: acyl-CoA thioesterase [Thermodesulfobacteriota bacterium]
MDNYVLVRPEHLNHYGYLFGGIMLKWVDEFAWLAASKEYRGCRLVTVAMDEIRFREPVVNGSILRFNIERQKKGRSSATYLVDVFSDEPGAVQEKWVFATTVTFVRVGESGEKKALP